MTICCVCKNKNMSLWMKKKKVKMVEMNLNMQSYENQVSREFTKLSGTGNLKTEIKG